MTAQSLAQRIALELIEDQPLVRAYLDRGIHYLWMKSIDGSAHED